MQKHRSEWTYQVTFTDGLGVQNDHFIVRKKDAMKKIAYALTKGYEVTAKRCD